MHMPTCRHPGHPVEPRGGRWEGFRFPAGGYAGIHVHLNLQFCDGLLVGNGTEILGLARVIGVYGLHSGVVSILLTETNGTTIELEGEFLRCGIKGIWTDEAGQIGTFTLWPRKPLPD